MAKTQSSKSPSRNCPYDKFCKATSNTLRHVSNFPKAKPNPKPRISYTQEIPIEYVPPPKEKSAKNVVRFSSNNVKKNDKEMETQKTFSEEKYNRYIDRVKKKMMSTSSDVGGGENMSKRDSFNDKVSGYIRRAKLKLRSTTSMGANGKVVSFK